MQDETIIYGQSMLYCEIVVNATYLSKWIHGSNWYTKPDINEVVIPLHIIVHPKINFFVPNCGENFPGIL